MFPEIVRLKRYRRFRAIILEVAEHNKVRGNEDNLYEMAKKMNRAKEVYAASRVYERHMFDRLAARILRKKHEYVQ